MAKPVVARLTATEGRKFGVPVGIAFVLLALVMAWRDHDAVARVTGGLGLVLITAGLVIPTYLGPVYRAWMGLALLLSRVTTPIFMGVTFFLVITPIGLVMRLLGRNPVVRQAVGGSYWIPRAEGSARRSNIERQF